MPTTVCLLLCTLAACSERRSSDNKPAPSISVHAHTLASSPRSSRSFMLGSARPSGQRVPSTLVDFRRTDCLDTRRSSYFFPPGLLGQTNSQFDGDAFLRQALSDLLRSLQHPTLSCAAFRGETYRFLWVRAFHDPVVVTVAMPTTVLTLGSISLDGALEPTTRVLPAEDQVDFALAVARADFWHLPTSIDRIGPDGAFWVLEGRRSDAYRVINRWSPTTGPFRDLGLHFLRLARLPSEGPSVY